MKGWLLPPLVLLTLAPLGATERPLTEDPRSVLVTVLNVREAGSLDAPVQSRLSQGDVVCVMGENGPWLEVAYLDPVDDETGDLESRVGFVHRGFVSSEMRSDLPRYEEALEYCRLALPSHGMEDAA